MNEMNKAIFNFEMKVRDYECDSQGIVNNANYLHYLENTRNEFMSSLGCSFAALHRQGIDPVVAHVDLYYKAPLAGGESFISGLWVERSGVKVVFHQTVCRKSDRAVCCEGVVEVVILIDGKLSRGDCFDAALKNYL
jgi:acyl-CoA thioester hydrolase